MAVFRGVVAFFFNWRIIALHCCGFCCTTMKISHNLRKDTVDFSCLAMKYVFFSFVFMVS